MTGPGAPRLQRYPSTADVALPTPGARRAASAAGVDRDATVESEQGNPPMDQQLALQLVWHIEEWSDKYHDADPASHSQITRDAHDLLLRLREVLRREAS